MKHIFRQLAGDHHGPVLSGIREGQPAGVKGSALKTTSPIQGIPGQGVPQVAHVDPDLVGAAGMQGEAHQRQAGTGSQDSPGGPGGTPCRMDLPDHAVGGTAPYGKTDFPDRGMRTPFHQGQIFLDDPSGTDLPVEQFQGPGIFGAQKDARSVLVQPAGGTEDSGVTLQAEMGRHTGGHAGAGMPAGGKRGHSRRFVYRQEVAVFPEHRKAGLSGHRDHRAVLRKAHQYPVSCGDRIDEPGGTSVDGDQIRGFQPGQEPPGYMQLTDQHLPQGFSLQGLRHGAFQGFLVHIITFSYYRVPAAC